MQGTLEIDRLYEAAILIEATIIFEFSSRLSIDDFSQHSSPACKYESTRAKIDPTVCLIDRETLFIEYFQ